MALISVYTLIRAISLFHITLAWVFLTAPKVVTDQNVVYILGESLRLVGVQPMDMTLTVLTMLKPHVSVLDKPNEASAFIAVILAFLGVADLTAASMDEHISLEYWLSNAPVRLVFLFALTGYVYLFKDDGLFGSNSLLRRATPGDLLRNSLVFGWAFIETAAWFWVSK